MKFKEIKPGMVIHCPKKKNAKKLLKHLEELGYTWNGEAKLLQDIRYIFGERTCYGIEKDMIVICADIGYFKDRWHEITEFSDLVWQEPSAVELLKFFYEHYTDGKFAEAFGGDYCFTELLGRMEPEDIVERVQEWLEKNKSRETETITKSKVEEMTNIGINTLRKQLHDALEMVEEAIEKGTPVEPGIEDSCPVCGCYLRDDDGLWAQYCPDCGQKINLEGGTAESGGSYERKP